MKPPPFRYERAGSVEEAVALLAEHGDDAKVLAGGQSLLPLMAFRLARPSVLVDIGAVGGLDTVGGDGSALRLGALTTHRKVELGRGTAPFDGLEVLPRAAGLIGHLPIRTRGTVGGSLAHADPTSEWCLLGVLLDASVEIAGPTGTRRSPVASLLRSHFTTDLAPDEVITAASFPRTGRRCALVEHAPRSGDFALVAAAVSVDVRVDGSVREARVVLGGVAPTPVRCPDAEAELDGRRLREPAVVAAARAAAASVSPPGDAHASTAYRRRLAGVLVRRALEQVAHGGAEAAA